MVIGKHGCFYLRKDVKSKLNILLTRSPLETIIHESFAIFSKAS